jgi:light-harvesting protein B-800-850 alpha chain
MIYGKIWTVVKPSVGIPLFLSAVAIGSVFVHTALVLNTTWVKKFLNGSAATATAQADTGAAVAAAPPTTQRQ